MSKNQIRSPARRGNRTDSDEPFDESCLEDENQKLRFSLSQKSQEFNEMKQKYESLLNVMSSQNFSAQSPAKFTTNSQFSFENNKNNNDLAEIELQQWNQTWTRIMTMASRHFELPVATSISLGDQKRTILIDLISKFCEMLDTGCEPQKYETLNAKYQKAKKALLQIKNQFQDQLVQIQKLQQLVEENFHKQSDQPTTFEIKIQDLIEKQLEEQKLLKKEKRKKIPKTKPQPEGSKQKPALYTSARLYPSFDSSSEIEILNKKSKNKQFKNPALDEYVGDSLGSSSSSYSSQEIPKHTVTSQTQNSIGRYRSEIRPDKFSSSESEEIPRKSPKNIFSKEDAEIEAKNICSQFSQECHHSKKQGHERGINIHDLRQDYGNHVNELVELTNQLRDDYVKLRKKKGESSELTLSHLSKLNDSCVKAEQALKSE